MTQMNKIIKYIVIGLFTFIAIRYIPTHANIYTRGIYLDYDNKSRLLGFA